MPSTDTKQRAFQRFALLIAASALVCLTGCETVYTSVGLASGGGTTTASPVAPAPVVASPAPAPPVVNPVPNPPVTVPTPAPPVINPPVANPTPAPPVTNPPVANPTPAPPVTNPPVASPTPAPPVASPPAAPDPTTLRSDLNESSVFLGASIIQYWPLPVHNAGVAGQTSYLVLQRVPKDVLHHGYARVIIQVGSNDILQGVKDPPGTVSANVASMGQEAHADNLDVIILSLGPITSQGRNYDASSQAVNVKLQDVATQNGYRYVDIFTPLQGHPEYFKDGLHPNSEGYAIIEKALAKALK